MIPKKIHYCWFGRREKPKLAQKCIASWGKFCPDYEIIEWNEDNFDLDYSPYTRYCYDNGKWAYLSDLVRLVVVFQYGGIYFDTDVEVISSFDTLLEYEAFFGFENVSCVNTGQGFGAVAGNAIVAEMIKQYASFVPKHGEPFRFIGCPELNTKALVGVGLKLDGSLQKVGDVAILPIEYMNPYDDPTGRLHKTKNTLSIHWYSKSALSHRAILISKITRPFHRIFGIDCFSFLKR